jgi:hypothetical protein
MRSVSRWLRRRRRAARFIREQLDDDDRRDYVGDADCGPGNEKARYSGGVRLRRK